MTLEITISIDQDKFKASFDKIAENFEQAFSTSKNMIASMLKDQIIADITGAGKFGQEFLKGLTVEVDDDSVVTTLTAPGANVFEDGGTIHGTPLLWIPISGTDAEGVRAANYGTQLFSVNRKSGGPPLLLSIADHMPKYFGVASVTIPKTFHIMEIQEKVMTDFRDIFQTALGKANG